MALIIKDRVKETTITAGTIPFVLGGAVNEYQTFLSTIGNANTTPYAVEDVGGVNWEVGIGQYIGANNSLIRTTILASSNNNSIVNFSAGPKNIFVTVPAAYTALTARDLTQFAPTTAANLRSIIVDDTGTGSLVFSNNAVLVNPTLGTANGTSLYLTGVLSAGSATVTGSLNANTLTITSSDLVANLNADLLDSRHVGTSGNAIAALNQNNIWTGEQRFESTTTYMGDPTSNTYFEFGRGPNYPYIDFHSNTAVDFSGRIGCSGATAGSGGGTLDYIAATHNFSSGDFIAAGSYGTVTIGNSTRPQALNFGTGATGSGNTKSIGIGVNGVSGSVTNITLGSSVQGATGKTIANQGIQAGSNGTPIYQTKLDFGGDVLGSWRKLVSVSVGTGQYQTAGYKIDIVDPNANHAIPASINADKYTYYVACDRTDGTIQDVPDACYISGPANHIRAVKLSTGNYEIQVSNEQLYQEYLITVQLYTENGGLNAATYYDGSAVGSAGIATYTAAVGSATDWFQQVRVASNGSGDALRITQTGGGNALVVEDETNPDSTPFVITGGGQVIVGFNNQIAGAVYNPKFQIAGSNPSQSGIGQFYYNNDSLSAWYQFNKTRATAPAGHVIVADNDALGVLTFAGSDGTGYIRGASIAAYVDGTPGTNDMPGRLVFSTTADGASAPTEAMRINNAQNVGIGTTGPTAKLDVVGSVKISQDLSVSGNVYISGNTTTLSSNNLVLNDSIIYLANNNPANLNDIGFVGNFTSGTYQHTGLVRDATDGVWKLFSNVVSEPTNTIDFTSAIYDSIRVGDISANSIVISSNNLVANLNSDLLDGQSGSYYRDWANLLNMPPLLSKGTDIPNAADLNTYTVDGYYHQNTNAQAAAGTNYPIAMAGMLEVTSDGTMVYQIYHVYNDSAGIYRRTYYSGTWYSWKRIWDSGNDGTGSGLDADLLDGKHVGTSGSAIAALDGTNTWGGAQQFNNNIVITGTSSGPILRLTQTGTGNAILVEDETNPDSTPFVVDAAGSVGIGTSTPLGKLGIVGSTVGANVGDQTIYTTFSSSDNGVNNDSLQISNIRLSTGAGWTGSGSRLQQKVDSTWMGYIQFNGNTNNGGISFGTGQSTASANAVSEALRINSSGAVGIGTNSNPNAILDLNNSFYSGTPSNLTQLNNKITLFSEGTTPTYGFGVSTSFLNITAGQPAAGIRFSTGGATERVRISNTGNFGIGTTNPTEKLDVAGNVKISQDLSVSGNVSTNFLVISSNTLVANLNSDMLDSRHVGTSGSAIAALDGNNIWGGTQRINNNFVVSGSAGDSLVRITQTGTGLALTVEDETNPDSTPFVVDANGSVGIGTTSPAYKLHVVGSFAANTKSFVIDHPTKSGMKLRYGSLEGPENGVYVRGRTQTTIIELPDYWTGLVDSDSITVNLTPIGSAQNLYVEKIQNNCVYIAGNVIDCFYTVYGERKDVEKLLVEF